jgi:predicted nucleotidyltransferase
MLVTQMRVDPKGTIGGYAAVFVRDALRRLRVYLYWDLARLEAVARLPAKEARAFAKAMVSAGLIERAESGGWSVTPAGQALSSAPAAARLTRAAAERALQEFMTRVDRVNHDHMYLGKVAAVVLFGRMLKPEVDRPSDVDIAVEVIPEDADRKRAREKNERRVHVLEANGHRFRGVLDRQMCWCREGVTHLKGRSRGISLVDLRREGEIVWAAPHRILYSERGWKPYIPPPPPVVHPTPPDDDCPF